MLLNYNATTLPNVAVLVYYDMTSNIFKCCDIHSVTTLLCVVIYCVVLFEHNVSILLVVAILVFTMLLLTFVSVAKTTQLQHYCVS